MSTHQSVDGVVHHHLIRGMIDAGRCSSAEDLSTVLDVPIQEIKTSLRRLEENHGVVLHPHGCFVWMVHPFAVSPSNTWVQQGDRGWWAPCVWCALGVATLVGGQVTIHGRIGGEAEPVRIPIKDGHPELTGMYAHFALPPKHVWDNVHHYCSMLLPFKTEQQIDAWSTRHGLPRGEAVPILRAAALARAWYGRHADPEYRKWTPQEAQKIFADVGLTGDFWELDSSSDRF